MGNETDRFELRIDLTAALVDALGTDAVDVVDLDAVRPAVGLSALKHGHVVAGDRSVADRYVERFRRARSDVDETHEDRMRRFDSILKRLEGLV